MQTHSRQAIVTRLLPITDEHIDPRIEATCNAKTEVVDVDDLGHPTEVWQSFANHHEAAVRLAASLGWLDNAKLFTGTMPAALGGDFVHVVVPA